MKKRIEQPLKESKTYAILSCPLFQHMKHTDACTVLRAKGVCKVNCLQYFTFALENKQTVESIIQKHEITIQAHRDKHGLKEITDLVSEVLPAGENLCEFCGKAFKAQGHLARHVQKKHKRARDQSRKSGLQKMEKTPG